jgi:hypothetical protein
MTEKKKCPECGLEFTPNRWWQEFCCAKHRQDFHNRAYREAEASTKAEVAEQAVAKPKHTLADLGLSAPVKLENPATLGSPWRSERKIFKRNAKLQRLIQAGKLKPMSKDEMRDECERALLAWRERT